MDDEDDGLVEVPVGDLVVDLESHEVRFPKATACRNGDIDQGLVLEAAVAEQPLPVLAQAFGELSDLVEEGAPEGWLLEIDPPDRRCEIEVHEGVALESYGWDQLYAVVTIALDRHFDEEFERRIDGIVEPMLTRLDVSYRISTVNQIYPNEVVVMVRFNKMAGKTGADLIALGDDVRALLNAARSGRAEKDVALNLVLGGHAVTLVGQHEGQWLDAKREPWQLATAGGKAEMAKDLSSLANAQGGLIIIPARTNKTSGRERIEEIRDLPVEIVDIEQIRDVLEHWVFPPLPGLVTELVETTEGRARLVVAVGPHRPENYPHLVVGDPAGSSHSVAAWVRDGDRNRPLTAPEIHALMRHPAASNNES